MTSRNLRITSNLPLTTSYNIICGKDVKPIISVMVESFQFSVSVEHYMDGLSDLYLLLAHRVVLKLTHQFWIFHLQIFLIRNILWMNLRMRTELKMKEF